MFQFHQQRGRKRESGSSVFTSKNTQKYLRNVKNPVRITGTSPSDVQIINSIERNPWHP